MNEKERHPTDEELEHAFAGFDASQKKATDYLDGRIRSRWTRKNEKTILITVKQLVIMVSALTKDSVMATQFDKRIMEAVQLQNSFLAQLAKKFDIELPKLTTEVGKLQSAIKDPTIAEVFAYLNERKKVLEEAVKSEENAGDKYVA